MSRVWTPYFQPPQDISVLSQSALKIIKFLENQEKFRRKSNDTFHSSHLIDRLPERRKVPSSSHFTNHPFDPLNFLDVILEPIGRSNNDNIILPGPSISVSQIFQNEIPDMLPEILPTKEEVPILHEDRVQNQSSYFSSPSNFTNTTNVGNNIMNLNESVDMFEDSILINSEFEQNAYSKIKRNHNMCKSKNKQKSIANAKITNYFSAIKQQNFNKCLISNYSEKTIVAKPQKTFLFKNATPKSYRVLESFSNKTEDIHSQTDNVPQGIITETGQTCQKAERTSDSDRNKKYTFDLTNPPNELNKSIKNLRPPHTQDTFYAGFNEMNNISKINNMDDMNIGQHDESLIEASSYCNDTSRACLEYYSQMETTQNGPIEICNVSIKNHTKLFNDLTSDTIDEIGLTLCYREGFSLLNKSTRTNCNPNGLLLCTKFSDGMHKMIFFSNDCFKEDSLRNFLLHLLRSFTRKICFDAQILILYILDNIMPNDIRICYEWCILDPLVGAWLLNPDHPPSSLDDFLKVLPDLKVFDCLLVIYHPSSSTTNIRNIKITGEIEKGDDWKTNCCYLLVCQSKIMEILYSKLMNENLWGVFLHLETQIIPILSVMEASEILVNTDKLKNLSTVLQKRLETLEKEAELSAGQKLSLNSTTQVRKVLYEKLKLDEVLNITIKGTSIKGVKSTSEAMLKLLIKAHSLPSLILEYRQLFKLKSAYTDALFEYARKKKCISSMWDLCSAATGRITSSNPNLQAIPKQCIRVLSPAEGAIEINLRSCFVAREDYVFVSADFQHIELRIFAILSQDNELLELFKKTDDIFSKMTQLRLNKNEITVEERNQTKTLVYALMYGAGNKKIAGILSLSETEAEKIRNTFLRIFPALSEFNRNKLNEARQFKVLKSLSGRKRIFPNILSSNAIERKYSERQAMNFVIQVNYRRKPLGIRESNRDIKLKYSFKHNHSYLSSLRPLGATEFGSAADICKGAMLRCEIELKKKPLNSRLLIQIHDELLWEVKEIDIPIFKDIIKDAMDANRLYWIKKIKIDIPLPVAITIGKNWGSMK